MAVVKTTLSLSSQDRQWIDGMVSSGEFVSSSEYVRNLIRRDREQRSQIEAIRAKLIHAEQSGFTDSLELIKNTTPSTHRPSENKEARHEYKTH